MITSANSFVVAAGDINSDGWADVLIGAAGHANYMGRTYVIFGGPGVGSQGVLALSGLNGTNGFKLDGEAVDDNAGFSVSGMVISIVMVMTISLLALLNVFSVVMALVGVMSYLEVLELAIVVCYRYPV